MIAGLATISRITPPILGTIPPVPETTQSTLSLKVDPKLKHVIHNSVTIYSDQHATSKIISVVDEFPEI